MYVYLRNNIVWEFIPEIDPRLPGIPVEQRYPKSVVDSLLSVEDVSGIQTGYIYDPETQIFSEPPEPEPEPEGEPVKTTPTPQDDTDAMLVDHEYRITLLELGLTE